MRVTINPAMLLYLNGLNSIKGSPNENFAREMMELFTLGHGSGYTERDVREQARALTGWTADWKNGIGWTRFHFKAREPRRRDEGVFGKAGPFNWKTAVKLCIEHPAHAGVLREQALELLRAGAARRGDRDALLEQLYVHSGYQVRPGGRPRSCKHPLLYEGPRMVKSPVVYTAGLLRQRGDRIETEDWIWLDAMAGQQLFYPPNVAGWDDDALARHLDVPRPLADRAAGAPEARVQPRPRDAAPTGRRPTRRSSSTARSAGGARSESRRRRAPRSSTTPRRRWPPRSRTTTGRRRSRS